MHDCGHCLLKFQGRSKGLIHRLDGTLYSPLIIWRNVILDITGPLTLQTVQTSCVCAIKHHGMKTRGDAELENQRYTDTSKELNYETDELNPF